MREIKFRVWDKKAEYFLPGGNIISFTQDDGLLRKDIEVMQYTGLKDKNGKEIFEGDIIRDGEGELIVIDGKHYDTDSYPIINCDFNMFIYIVEYSESHSGLWSRTQEDIEIIGNIYENKDLLNND